MCSFEGISIKLSSFEEISRMFNFENISIGLFSLRRTVLSCFALRRLVLMFNFENISIGLFSLRRIVLSCVALRGLVLSC